MRPRENLIAAPERRQPGGRVPHYEPVFFLTTERMALVGNVNCGMPDTGMRLSRYELMPDLWRRERQLRPGRWRELAARFACSRHGTRRGYGPPAGR